MKPAKCYLALLLLCSGVSAQAAHLELIDQQLFGGYDLQAVIDAQPLAASDLAQDLSTAGNAALFGAQSYSGAGLAHGYSADAFSLPSAAGGTDWSLSFSSVATLEAGAGNVQAFSHSGMASLTKLRFRLVADAGDVANTPYRVSFNALASYLDGGSASALQRGLLLDIALLDAADQSIGDLLWDASNEAGDTRTLNLSFVAGLGDEVSLAANITSFASLDAAASFAPGSTLLDHSAQIVGGFSVAAVPEPGAYATLLAGLGLLGLLRRRRA